MKKIFLFALMFFWTTPLQAQTTLGTNACATATSAGSSLCAGAYSGYAAAGSDVSALVGYAAGLKLQSSPYATIVGPNAGEEIGGSVYVTALGASAARYAKDSEGAVFLGLASGYFAKRADYSFIGGYAAARFIENNYRSTIIGYAAGEYANRASYSVLQGMHGGYRASDSDRSVMIGNFAGAWADNSPQSVMIGDEAGGLMKLDADPTPSANHVLRGVYVGTRSGRQSSSTTDAILIGTDASAPANVSNVIGLGKNARPERSNAAHVPDDIDVGLGVGNPTAQLDVNRTVRFRALTSGVVVADANGNLSTTDLVSIINALTARVAALEAAN